MSVLVVSIAAGVLASLFTLLFSITRKIYFDELSSVPGPAFWAISRIPYVYYMRNGQLVHRIAALHDKYGGVVRVAPNEVSFSAADAWADVYSYRGRLGAFPKNPIWHPHGPPETNSISTADPIEHARIRRVLARGFDGNAFNRQEPILQATVDRLVQRLRATITTAPQTPVNMTQWLNFCTFDMVGQMGFSEDIFECLERAEFPESLLHLFSGSKSIAKRISVNLMPILKYWQDPMILFRAPNPPPPNMHAVHIEGCIDKRMLEKVDKESVSDSPDFLAALKDGFDDGIVSKAEMRKTAHTLFGGGGGTTASALSGTINHLLRYPKVFAELKKEVRTAFTSSADMSTAALENLDYLNGVIQEGLRLCPPMPCGVARAAPQTGGTVSGYKLPGGTNVCVQHFSAHRNPASWAEPNRFAPERWLPMVQSDEFSKYHNDKRLAMRAFSLGPRRCIGEKLAYAEMRLILATLVFEFEIEAASGPDGSPLPKWEEQKTWPLWDKHPFYVHLKTRELL